MVPREMVHFDTASPPRERRPSALNPRVERPNTPDEQRAPSPVDPAEECVFCGGGRRPLVDQGVAPSGGFTHGFERHNFTCPSSPDEQRQGILKRKQVVELTSFGNFRKGSLPRDPINQVSRSEEHTSELQSLRHLVC